MADHRDAAPGGPAGGPAASGPGTLSVHLELPEQAYAGETVGYPVVLANNTGAGVVAQRCPSYVQVLAGAAGAFKAAGILECGALRLPAGSSTAFDVRVRVPSGLEPGRYRLTWRAVDVVEADVTRELVIVSPGPR